VVENKISLAIRTSNKNFVFNVNSLLHPIDLEKSYKKIKSDMIAVFLKKEKEGLTWKYLTSTEKHLKSQKEKMFEKDESGAGIGDGDPGSALMNMMKKMYETGDDQMKRTIQKAWIEGQEKKSNNFMM
jgi:calcyclin binding protein